jgi:KilA-N domain
MSLTIHQFQDREISQRVDGYVNLTQLCKAGNKLVADYLRQDSTKDYLEALSLDMGIPIMSDAKGSSQLVEISYGGNQTPGTWAHPEVAIDCAQWVSTALRIWANRTLVKVVAGTLPEMVQKALPTRAEIRQTVITTESQIFSIFCHGRGYPVYSR